MLEGEHIHLRAWHELDVPALLEVRNDHELQEQLLARVKGSTAEQVRGWLANRSAGPGSLLFVIARRADDAVQGYLQVTDINREDRRGEFGICLRRGSQGHGYGTEAIRLLLPYLVQELNFHSLGLRVRADNAAAIRCYEKAGFVRRGELRDHSFIRERWHDVVLMQCMLASGA